MNTHCVCVSVCMHVYPSHSTVPQQNYYRKRTRNTLMKCFVIDGAAVLHQRLMKETIKGNLLTRL